MEYRNSKGELHREDGPAYGNSIGTTAWYINGELHRADGPSVEYHSGSKQWWMNGELHCITGPAIIHADGVMSWYINGTQVYNQTSFQLKSGISDEAMVILILKYDEIT